MTSTIVPPVDLAPGMPSRVVTISATDVTEGGTSLEGQMVRFALSDTLDVSSGGDVIAKTQAEVVLDAQGNGSIRLPVYDEDVRTWCGQDWAILVTATWGSQKAIRVPAGTTSIALSALPPVRPLRGREKQWAITGASVTVTEGGQWDATLDLSGGILNLGLTVPPGGVSYWKGRGVLPAYADLNTYRTPELNGSWSIGDNNLGTYTNLPPGLTTRASLEVISPNAWTVTQRVTGTTGTVHTRALYNSSNGVWSEWTTPFKGEGRGVLPANADLDTYRTPAHNGDWGIGDTHFATYVGLPPGVTARSTLEVVSPNAWTVTQRVTTMGGVVHTRALQNHANDTWTPWSSTQHGSGATVTALPTRDWVHWGDSLTDDSVLGSNSWVSKLAGLTGANHLNEGWYSQRAENIAARQGGLPALVTLSGGEIPASGPIAVTDIVNSPVIANRPSHQVVGELAGRGGYLVADGTGPTGVQFVASPSSTSTPCPPGSVFTPLGPASLGTARHMTICIGANSRMDTEPQVIVSMVQAMIDYQTTRVKRVLVLEIPNRANQAPGGESEQRTGAINAALQAAFPSEYIPLATWLGTDEAAAAAGITFTPEDLTDIGNKLVPRVFRADYVHWNELASTVIADYLYSQAQARGWL